MNPPEYEMYKAYYTALYKLRRTQVNFAIIGTFGFMLNAMCPPGYKLKDCDLIAPFDTAHLNTLLDALRKINWKTFSWNESLTANATKELLAGRYYLRATLDTNAREKPIIDIMYEHDFLPVDEIVSRAIWNYDLPIACLDDLKALKLSAKRERDVEFLNLL